jgi:PAS domain S-box-containing protein
VSPDRPAVPDTIRLDERMSDLYRLLVLSVSDYGVFALDPAGYVVSWNSGAERIKGYTADEIIGQSFERFYPADAIASGFPRYELEVAQREGRFEDDGWRVRKDGSRFWANVVITALNDSSGHLLGFAKVTRDLTARREAEEQVRRLAAEEAARAEAERRSDDLARVNARLHEREEEARLLAGRLQVTNLELQAALAATKAARDIAERAAAEATEAYRELDQFAYVASHDLKAPLRGIANLAQWIQDDAGELLDGESAEHMRLLQGRVHRMEALIDGILAYSRAGRILATPEPIDTGVLVREIVEMLAPPAGVTIEVQESLPTLMADRVPLQQVFMNLMGNALKYAHAERPDVMIRVTWQDLGDAFAFAVSDNGPGIPPQYHDRIWGIFQTLEARDKVEGTGIGLSLVKKVVETRGGRVSVESTPGQGATFGFTWPKNLGAGASA